jgi:outer membrane protein assembly factor BamE (lipoprotein component of BamABCDE complex)
MMILAAAIAGCTSRQGERHDQAWTERELKSLQGKTRDEVRDLLGNPNGLYTFDSKDRWHFANVLLQHDQPGSSERVSVLVYFSKLGEHRATIIEIRHRSEE